MIQIFPGQMKLFFSRPAKQLFVFIMYYYYKITTDTSRCVNYTTFVLPTFVYTYIHNVVNSF